MSKINKKNARSAFFFIVLFHSAQCCAVQLCIIILNGTTEFKCRTEKAIPNDQ